LVGDLIASHDKARIRKDKVAYHYEVQESILIAAVCLRIHTSQRRTRLAEEAEGDDGEAAEGTVLRLLARAEVTAATALPTVVDVGLRLRADSAVKCRTEPWTAAARLLPS